MSSSMAMSAFLCLLALTLPAVRAENASDTVTSFLHSTNEINWSGGILAILAIAVGAGMVVAGYRLFRFAIFICGFILGGVGIASVVEYICRNQSYLETASWIAFLVGGIVVGLLAMSMYTTSIFVAGAAGGVLLAFTLQTTVAYHVSPNHPNVVLIVLAIVLGLLCGALALKLEKPVLVIATSFVGAVMVAWGVGYYAGDFPNGADLDAYRHKDISNEWVYSIPDAWWGYLAGIIVLFVLGLAIQFRKTGRDYQYQRGKAHRAQAHASIPAYDGMQTPPADAQHGHHGGNPRYGNPVSHV